MIRSGKRGQWWHELGRSHCSSIDVHVRVNLDAGDLEAKSFQQQTGAGGDDAFPDAGDDACTTD